MAAARASTPTSRSTARPPPPRPPSLRAPQAYPLDLVRTRLAAQTGSGAGYYSGIGGALRRILAEEGAAGLYRGLGATLLQVRAARGVCGPGSRGAVQLGAWFLPAVHFWD